MAVPSWTCRIAALVLSGSLRPVVFDSGVTIGSLELRCSCVVLNGRISLGTLLLLAAYLGFDGVRYPNLQPESLRRRIAVVQQDALVMSGSIRDSVRYGRLDTTDEDIEAAVKAAGALEFVLGLPDGFDSRLGESEQGLSGGQKQRLGIARAFLEESPRQPAQAPATIQQTADRTAQTRPLPRVTSNPRDR